MKAVILANGDYPESSVVWRYIIPSSLIICADGGANHAMRMHIHPHVIIGDMDSLTSATRNFFNEVPLIFIPDQDSTDMEKAIDYCLVRKCSSVDILGATGSRIDHTTASLGYFKKYRGKISMKIVDPLGEIVLVDKHLQMKTNPGDCISLIPMEPCKGVTTRNLKYSLRDESIALGVREGVSNVALARQMSVKVKEGTLLLFRMFNPVKVP